MNNKLDLSNKGAGVIGGAIGAAVAVAGGPVASIAGAALGSVLADTLKDMAARVLSGRERVRLDNATAYIADGIKYNIDAGLIVRQDDFFVGNANFSNDASELLEGVLLKCKAQYQEKKVRLIANIFKNTAFDATISAQSAYQFLNLTDTLTYYDLCIISYYGRRHEFTKIHLLSTSVYSAKNAEVDTISAGRPLGELMQSGIIKDPTCLHIGHTTIVPDSLELDTRGKVLFQLLELEQIPSDDILEAVRPLINQCYI